MAVLRLRRLYDRHNAPLPRRRRRRNRGGLASSAANDGEKADSAAGASASDPLDRLGNPAAVLVVSGEQEGYLEPCGCSEDQEGGLIRRYDLVERLHKRNWPTALIDLGTLIKDPAGARSGFEQAQVSSSTTPSRPDALEYSAVALSAEDLKVGVGEALGLFDNGLGGKTKIVVANVQPDTVLSRRCFRPACRRRPDRSSWASPR